MEITGRVWRFGDNIDTDVIVPGAYSTLPYIEVAKYVMAGIDPEFSKKIKAGDIIIAGNNFGIGSSRESAPWGLKMAGISVVIAASFGRIFYRNAINIGLHVIVCSDVDQFFENDKVTADLSTGKIVNITRGTIAIGEPTPAHLLKILDAGGLVKYLSLRFHEQGEESKIANTEKYYSF